MNITLVTNRIIRVCFYLLFGLTPLLLTPWNYELFEYNKMMATYALTAIIATAWIVKMIDERNIRVRRTLLDIPIALFGLSQLVSALFSIDPHVSWFGYYSRFNGGMWSIITYITLYYAFVTNITANFSSFLKIALGSATVIAAYGVAERLGIDKHLWVQDVQNRVFSTLGQPNWLAAYIVALLPITMGFSLQSHSTKFTIQKYFWTGIAVLLFVVLLFTRSRSGLVGLAVVDVLFWGMILFGQKKYVIQCAIFHVLFAVIIFFNGSNIPLVDRYVTFTGIKDAISQGSNPVPPPQAAGPLLEVGGTESGTIRKFVWQGALAAWRSSIKTLLIGTGTETFTFAFYRHRPKEHNMTSEWDFLYNKAHNEYLNYLATTGILGLGSYLIFICAVVYGFMRRIGYYWHKTRSKDTTTKTDSYEHLVLYSGIFGGWVSILITNFFGFSVVIVQLFFFLFPALLSVRLHKGDQPQDFSIHIALPKLYLWAFGFLGIMVVIRIASFWFADTLYATGYRMNRTGQYITANEYIERAIKLNPGEPTYHDELASAKSTLSLLAYEQQNATLSAQLALEAVRANEKAVSISPENVNFWKTRTKIYYSFSAINPDTNDEAIAALLQAARLSPNDPKIYYNLAILYGRIQENEKAVEILKKAIDLKPNYRDAYNGLYVFYIEMKRTTEANNILQTYITTVGADTEFQELLQKTGP